MRKIEAYVVKAFDVYGENYPNNLGCNKLRVMDNGTIKYYCAKYLKGGILEPNIVETDKRLYDIIDGLTKIEYSLDNPGYLDKLDNVESLSEHFKGLYNDYL